MPIDPNVPRKHNWNILQLRGVHATLTNMALRAPGTLGPGSEITGHVQHALREVEAALHVIEAQQEMERSHRAYRLSLWRPGGHPDCPMADPTEGVVHSTMRLGDAWAQVLRIPRNGGTAYTIRYNFETPESGWYRRPPEAQVIAVGRVAKRHTRDPRGYPLPGDRWAGDPDAPHLAMTLVSPVRLQLLQGPNDLTRTMLPSRVRGLAASLHEEPDYLSAALGYANTPPAPPTPTTQKILWRVRYTQLPHTGHKVLGLPNDDVVDLSVALQTFTTCEPSGEPHESAAALYHQMGSRCVIDAATLP